MKPEKEVRWIICLYNSQYCKEFSLIPRQSCAGSKKDFERIVGSSERNKEFNKWFNQLVDNDVIIYAGKITRGNNSSINGYIVKGSELTRYAKNNPLYQFAWKFFNSDRII